MKRARVLTGSFVLAFAMSVGAAENPSKPLTMSSLSTFLTSQCSELATKMQARAVPQVTLTETDCPKADQTAQCLEVATAKVRAAFVKDVDEILDELDPRLLAIADTSKQTQHIHLSLPDRRKAMEGAIAAVLSADPLSVKDEATPLVQRVTSAAKEKAAKWHDAFAVELAGACNRSGAAMIEAVFPTPPTAEQRTAAEQSRIHDMQLEAEQKAFAAFTQAEGFVRTVDCYWSDETMETGSLTCKPGLLVSGEQVSEIRVHGMPPNKPARITAVMSEDIGQKDTCADGRDLTCDQLDIPATDPLPVVIAVHTRRVFTPSWGGWFGGLGSAADVLRKQGRRKLSLVTNGTVPTINIGVRSGGAFASASVPVGYARWKIETGGFMAMTNVTDKEIVTKPDPSSTAANPMVRAVESRSTDRFVQDSGIFVNFVPQNYQTLGITLGLATTSGRPASIYIGPALRARTFGDAGLASLAAGTAIRSVKRFGTLPGEPIPADSSFLQGSNQFRVGWFVAVNLGFRFGGFGPAEEGDRTK